MKIAYLLESTFLCGGVKVVLRQAEALAKFGHKVKVVSGDPAPDWFEGEISFVRKDPFSASLGKMFDVLVATTPELLLNHFEHVRSGKIFHLIQGYEGDYQECLPLMDRIRTAYSLPVVKLTVSEHLSVRLSEMFPGRYFSVGQGLEKDFFYPGPCIQDQDNPHLIFLVGALSISVKLLEIGLRAFAKARKERPEIELVRISPVDTRVDEEEMTGPISRYHVHLRPEEVGRILRDGAGLFISPSGPGEGFGLPALEAMACGVPAVLTRIPSYTSFAQPADYARFVDPGSASSMARGILDLLDTPRERVRLVARGLEVASMYRFEKVAIKMERIFNNAGQ
jgi:glycosyltransferase involved in cell wall biosynthesis